MAAFGCEACCEAVEHLADLIEACDPFALKRCDGEAALAVFDQQAAAFEDLQGMADGLARNAEHLSNALLRKALARCEVARRNRGNEPVMDLINQGGSCLQLFQRLFLKDAPSRLACWNSEFNNWLCDGFEG